MTCTVLQQEGKKSGRYQNDVHSPTTKRKIKITLALIGRAQSYNKKENKNHACINRTCTVLQQKGNKNHAGIKMTCSVLQQEGKKSRWH